MTVLDDGNNMEDQLEFRQNDKQANFRIKKESQRMWPPWPWPPWDGDDDSGGGGGEDEPPKHRDIHKLAKNIVEFESRMARASLDL